MLALESYKILDLSHVGPGAFCTMLLADLGAEVIKIEAVAETSGRRTGTSPRGEKGMRLAAYDALNRNKKSVALNLRSEEGRKVFYRLARTADVIVEGFRPGVSKRLAIDYGAMSKINPRIVYCSLSGYGNDGPYSNLPGHDINYISMAGALDLIGTADGPPVIPINLLADYAGGSLHGVIGIMAALLAREKTGKGQYVDVAYLDSALSLLTRLTCDYFSQGAIPRRGETALVGAYPYYGVYQTKDGKYISIGCIEPWFWENLCRALGKEEYIPYHFAWEHRLHKPEGDKWGEISSFLKQVFLTRTSKEWFDFLAKNEVPAAEVYTLDEVFRDPQVLHRKMVLEIEHPTLGKVKQVGIAIKLSDTPGAVRTLAPLYGQHTEEILLSSGYKQTDIAALRQIKAIG